MKPLSNYDEPVIAETNSFKIEVLCRDDTPNMEFNDALIKNSDSLRR
jgi:hypothetical protein